MKGTLPPPFSVATLFFAELSADGCEKRMFVPLEPGT